MPTKSSTPLTTETHDRIHKFSSSRHYSEIARITAGLFIGVLALMTFLLTAGLQHPQNLFSFFVYASLVALPLGLVAFTIGHSVQQMSKPAEINPKAKGDTQPSTWTALKITRLIQQLLFVISIIAVTGLALVSAHIFFAPPAVPAGAGQAQTQAQ